MSILTLNAGSSSLKFALFGDGSPPPRLANGTIDRVATGGHTQALRDVLGRLAPFGGLGAVTAVGHRVVHGGPTLQSARPVDDAVLAELRRLRPLDPDHLPAEIAIIEAMREAAPTTPSVACFDTAFHASMPRASRLLALPRHYEEQGIRRYGFHGLSYQYLLEELARLDATAARGRVIFAHLGSGASLAAVRDGRCVDTTMSFTPNSGVPMGTRCGDMDPGVLIHLLRQGSLGIDALDEMLSKRSGLLGVSGTSNDMRDLIAREKDDPAAADAIALFCHAVRKAIGALAATIDGVDTLVFAAGIGERAPLVRARVCSGLGHLGIRIEAARNEESAPVISTDSSPCVVRVMHTDEEAIIARETLRAVSGGTP